MEPYVHLFLFSQDTFAQNFVFFFKVQGILIGAIATFVVIITIVGPEHHGSHFEKSKTAFEQGGGEVDPDAIVQEKFPSRNNSTIGDEVLKEETQIRASSIIS